MTRENSKRIYTGKVFEIFEILGYNFETKRNDRIQELRLYQKQPNMIIGNIHKTNYFNEKEIIVPRCCTWYYKFNNTHLLDLHDDFNMYIRILLTDEQLIKVKKIISSL